MTPRRSSGLWLATAPIHPLRPGESRCGGTRFAPLSPPRIARKCREAIALDPNNMVITALLGDAYAALGESALAEHAWRQAASNSPNWPDPCLSRARVLSSMGRQREAADAAREAQRRGPGRYDAQLAFASAALAALPAECDPRAIAELLSRLGQIQEVWPRRDQTLPVYVRALILSGQKEAASSAIRGALKAKHAASNVGAD